MSRVGKNPINLPKGVEAILGDASVKLKGPQGELSLSLHPSVGVEQQKVLQIRPGMTNLGRWRGPSVPSLQTW